MLLLKKCALIGCIFDQPEVIISAMLNLFMTSAPGVAKITVDICKTCCGVEKGVYHVYYPLSFGP